MIHYNTTNYSFLKVHLFLKKKGIKNNAFFLELMDESLENIDPFDEENLTEEQKQRIIIECTRNPWYFLRECVSIATSGVSKYELSLGNLALSWASLNNLNSYVIMPRQCGKTFGEIAIITWILYFGGHNSEIVLVAQRDKNLNNNMNRIRSIRDNLPSYLIVRDKRDRDGAELIDFKPLGNKVTKQTTGTNETEADSNGRGLSLPLIYADEISFTKHMNVFYKSLVLAHTTVAKRAEANGLPHFIAFTTTAGYLNNEDGIWAYNFWNNCFQFTEDLYDMPIEEVRRLIANEAKLNYLAIEYQYWDLGKGDDYFQEQCKALEYDQDAIDREVLNKWKAVSTVHPLGQQALALLEQNKKLPIHTVVLNKVFRMKLYKDPELLDWSIPYIIGGDCANNVGSDYSALVIVDPYTYEIVATIRSNMYSTALFANMLSDLMLKYFYRSILVLERNLNGATIIDRLIEINFSLASRIYSTLDKKTGQPKEFGINTTKDSRKILYGQILKIAVDDSYDRIYDRVIIDEIAALIITRNGRVDHPVGGHDDLLISWLFTRWFLLFGEDRDRYIDPLKIGCMLNEFSKYKGNENKMRAVTNEKLSDMEDEKKFKENEEKLRSNNRKEPMNIQQQAKMIHNGGFEQMNKSSTNTADKIFDNLYGSMGGRYDPIIEDQLNKQNDSGKLYTLDPEEMKKEEDKLYDEKYQMNEYNRNIKEDIGLPVKEIDTPSQFIRQENVYNNNDLQDDMNYFFKHLH